MSLAHMMQWIGLSGVLRSVHTGYCFCAELRGVHS